MNWAKLLDDYYTNYPFLRDMVVTNQETGQRSGLSRIIRYSAAFANRQFEQDKIKRLCIQMPEKSDAALWITLLAAFQSMKHGIDSIYAPGEEFRKGQKLRIYDAIVCYVGTIKDTDDVQKIGVYYDGDTHWMPETKFKSLFQRVNTNRNPSSHAAVKAAMRSAREYVANNDSMPLSAIERILGFRTYNNMALFSDSVGILTQSVLLDRFLEQYEVYGEKLDRLLLVASANEQGEPTIRQSGQYDCTAQLIQAYDMYNMRRYVRKHGSGMNGIIVDGMDMFVRSMSEIDTFLHETDMPLVVVCSDADVEQMHYLTERGFAIWQWHKKALSESGCANGNIFASAFERLDRRICNATNITQEAVVCRNPYLEEMYRSARSIEKKIRFDYPQFEPLYSEVMQTLVYVNRMAWLPTKEWYNGITAKVAGWRDGLARSALFLPDDMTDVFTTVFDRLESLTTKDFEKEAGKYHELRNLLKNVSGNTLIVVPKRSMMDFQPEVIAGSGTSIFVRSFDDLSNPGDASTYSTMIVTGWFRRNIMTYLLNSGIAPRIILLTYPWERQWFGQAMEKWRNTARSYTEQIDFGFLNTENTRGMDFPSFQYEHPREREIATGIEEDDETIHRSTLIRKANEKNQGRQMEVLSATMLLLADGWFMLATRDKTFLYVTPFIVGGRRSTETIPYRKLQELKAGDWVLIPETDKDILRNVVDRKLEREGRGGLRDIAGLWRGTIARLFQECWFSYSKLHNLLQRYGCKVTEQTVHGWVENDMIGPNERENIEIIALASGDDVLSARMDEVWNAICELRQMHMQAAGEMIEQLRREVARYMHAGLHSSASSIITLDISDFGIVHLMQIDEIDRNPIMTDARRVNKLYTEEAMMRWQE